MTQQYLTPAVALEAFINLKKKFLLGGGGITLRAGMHQKQMLQLPCEG